jgi:hypothetical protein
MNRYFELRPPSTLKSPVGNDIAHHFQTRQFLGSAVVVCEHPFAMLSVVRKSWQKIVRQTQIDRARTLNAEEILRFTRRIIQMQRLQFTSSLPDDAPCADVYFVTPQTLNMFPSGCYTLYLATHVTDAQLGAWTGASLSDSLVVNYDTGIDLRSFGLRPKSELEASLLIEWHRITDYLRRHGITQSQLDIGNEKDLNQNEILDILLSTGREFTEIAAAFQHQLDVTQPLANIPDTTCQRISMILRLAHRVQALTPPNPHLKQIFGNTETFFLRDRSVEQLVIPQLAVEPCT